MPTCTSCSAPITWARTANGKAMPLDAEPTLLGNIVIEGGIARFVTPDANALGQRYRSHFASCPAAAQHRRKR